jgi:uncharacterized Rmd1/YagE family protein
MLQLLKESVSSRHSERLEKIVIALIVIEIGRSLLYFAFHSWCHTSLIDPLL